MSDPDYKPLVTTTEDEQMNTKHKKQQTKIITPKKKKKYYSEDGEEITDPTLIQDLFQGKTIISYKEEKSGTDKPVVVKR